MKLYVIIGDGGLNGPWLEAVRTEPVDRDELRRMGQNLCRQGAPTGFQYFMAYEVDTDSLDSFREIE